MWLVSSASAIGAGGPYAGSGTFLAAIFRGGSLTAPYLVLFAPGIDEVPHYDWLCCKPIYAFLYFAIRPGESRMLPQMLSPRIDDERFEVVCRLFGIVIDGPARRTIPPPHP